MNLFQLGNITLSSGLNTYFKIECDALTDEDIDTLAVLIQQVVGRNFYRVVGVPRGGLRLAKALEKFASPKFGNCLLIVDDVLSTGQSMETTRSICSDGDVVGAVIFARGKCPDWIKAVCQLPECLWVKQ